MLQENIIVSTGDKKYSLTSEYKENDDIILEDGFGYNKIIFSSDGFDLFYNKLKEIYVDKKSKEKITNKETKYIINNVPVAYIENNKTNCTLKEFLTDYTMNTSYIDVFKFLREKEILEYIVLDGKNNNYPTNKFKHWFICEDAINDKTGTKFIRMYLTEVGKQGMYKILSDNCIISNSKVN
jgi:hypothetical protein